MQTSKAVAQHLVTLGAKLVTTASVNSHGAQVKLAVELQKPLFMHCREAAPTLASVLRCLPGQVCMVPALHPQQRMLTSALKAALSSSTWQSLTMS